MIKLEVTSAVGGVKPPWTPQYAHPGDAGFDIQAHIAVTIPPKQIALVKTGIKVAVPDGYELQVRPRSGLALKKGITVWNSPGTVDSQYRGEVGVILYNGGDEDFEVNPGDRIAQGVVAAVPKVEIIPVDYLGATERGEGGFGSTGV